MSLSDDWKTKKGFDRFWTWIFYRPYLVFVAFLGAFYYLIIFVLPSGIALKDNRRYYNECLQIVLARAAIDVAEQMCGHMRK